MKSHKQPVPALQVTNTNYTELRLMLPIELLLVH